MLVSCVLAVLSPQGDVAAARPPHWAYVTPMRPEIPRSDVHAIDAFLEPRLLAAGLVPAPEADRATLLRRLSFDLIGLPPSPAELDAFLADTAPGAYEHQVDRLLASPHFGEHQAVAWLDLARYADTGGFNFDQTRAMWKWRDWVVDAFDSDLPFDRFTLLQLAGDLLPDAGEDGRIAVGFHRNTMLNDEGGVDPAEARWERLVDRTTTTATVWLGASLQCAQCHDHKFDPIAQRDFYGLLAFFEPAEEVQLDLATPDQARRRDELRARVAALQAAKAPAAEIAKAEKAAKAFAGDSTLSFVERRDVAAATEIRLRGSYDARGERVTAAVPPALGPRFPAGAAQDRLGLARWLVDPTHPLVARVHVNRVWAALFGRPLVGTPEDFGTQSPPRDHPELHDWLATEFVRLGFSHKALLRTLVTSQAYRRSAVATAEDRALDPDNRWYARGPRFRLTAEQIRDQWLAVGGLLSPHRGGPPVFPLQADTQGVVPTNKADVRWQPSDGEARHRRALYTFWRRTQTFVQFAAFDAPSREQCTVRRQRTNSPLQALAGLNDPAAWEAAQALGERMRTHAGDDRARLAFGFRLCTSRPPTERELDRLAAALAAETGPLRWTLLANAMTNLDEALVR
ncbi:MAG: DUF1553 domain-containing protein [Planctomycetes bacterium]|nr:DUF1553 domain-containing protein [Planctomycetota bacterium]